MYWNTNSKEIYLSESGEEKTDGKIVEPRLGQ